jgi:uncharacterized protein YjiS (DUF1127 family)
MASTLISLASHPARRSGGRRPSVFARAAQFLAREFRARRDLRLLSSLDESALRDIGLSRGGLEDAVRHGRGAVVPARAPRTVPEVRTSPFLEWR